MSSKLPLNLEDLLHQRKVEGDRIEYKKGWNPDPIIRTICAFANDFENLGGGYIVIGQDCDETGIPIFPPTGIADNQLDTIQQELLSFCNQIQPLYFPRLSVEQFEDRNLIVLWVPGGENRPYKAPKAVTSRHKNHKYYIRRYASTVEARGDDERELIALTANLPYDDRYHPSASVDDLSAQLMGDFLREVGSELVGQMADLSIETLGKRINVIGGAEEVLLPKNVGLLFFNEHPRRFFPATQIDVVWFPEGAGGDRFDEKIFEGPLAHITRDALSYIQTNHLKQTVIKHPDRAESERFWNFPYAAVEETIVNAVYHRSYEEREPIEVRITREDLVVLSFPGPDRSIRMEDLKSGRAVSRRYRNRRIGEFLKELDLTEGRSTGISKILKVMKENGSAEPEFDTDESRSYFLVRLPVHPNDIITPTVKEKASEKTSEKILKEVRNNRDVTIADLSRIIGVTTRSIERNINKLQEGGQLERIGPDKGGYWIVTEKGGK